MVMLSNVVGILVGRRVSGGWTVCLCVVLCHSVDESCELGIVGCHDAWSGAVGVVAQTLGAKGGGWSVAIGRAKGGGWSVAIGWAKGGGWSVAIRWAKDGGSSVAIGFGA